MKVRVTNTALVQLDTILTELDAINPAARTSLVKRFQAALRLLADFPQVAQSVEQRPEMRRLRSFTIRTLSIIKCSMTRSQSCR
jgi:plasmid stabilization system protein ParE